MIARCPEPLELAVLVNYWFGELPEQDQERVDEHLFDCGECSARLQVRVNGDHALAEGPTRPTT